MFAGAEKGVSAGSECMAGPWLLDLQSRVGGETWVYLIVANAANHGQHTSWFTVTCKGLQQLS